MGDTVFNNSGTTDTCFYDDEELFEALKQQIRDRKEIWELYDFIKSKPNPVVISRWVSWEDDRDEEIENLLAYLFDGYTVDTDFSPDFVVNYIQFVLYVNTVGYSISDSIRKGTYLFDFVNKGKTYSCYFEECSLYDLGRFTLTFTIKNPTVQPFNVSFRISLNYPEKAWKEFSNSAPEDMTVNIFGVHDGTFIDEDASCDNLTPDYFMELLSRS